MSQPSKFKNALGYEKKEKYTNCAVSSVSTEGRLIAVNCNFLAMSWNNAGEIVVVDSSKQISINPKQARIKGHRASSLDLEFSPFSSDLLAAAFDDGAVLLYKIPEGGITENITQEVQLYNNHTKKVPFVTFNPIASDVVCSAAFNGEIHVWSAIQGDTICQVNAEDTPTSLSWSPNGVLIGATTKNKFVHIFDPRNNKAGMKILKLWDIRKVNPDLTSSEVTSVQIDTSKTVSTPFVDRESKLVYTIGKGEAYIHYYDYSEGKFVKGIDYKATEPSISSVMFERKCLDYNKNEIDRFARYVNSQKVYYISFNIARRNPGFDQSLYPPVEYGEAALTVEQWKGGETAEPLKKEINTIENKFVSKVESFVKQEPKTVQKKPDDKVKELEGKLAELSVKYNQLELENEKLKKELQQLE